MTPPSPDEVALKPCPFCGAAPAHDHTRVDGVRFSCLTCEEAAFEDFDEARAFWNRRAPALSVPEGWVAVPREVVEPFARAADWEERCIDPDYGIARVRPLKDSRRVAVTLGECRAVRAALSAMAVIYFTKQAS